MPHLFYMNRYWMISSDDFPIFLSFPAWIRFIFIFVSVLIQIVWAHTLYSNLSLANNKLCIYFNVSLFLLFGVLLSESLLITRSFIGTIIDNQYRVSQITEILKIRTYLLVCQFLSIITGIIIIIITKSHPYYENMKGYYYLLIFCSLSIVYHSTDVIGVIIAYRLFSYNRNIFYSTKIDRTEFQQLWKLRCLNTCYIAKILTCGLFGGRFVSSTDISEDIESVASLLTDLFHNEGLLDVVFTDIVAGMVLVGHYQKLRNMNMFTMKRDIGISGEPIRDAESLVRPNQSLLTDQLLFDDMNIKQPFNMQAHMDDEDNTVVAEKLHKYCVYSCSIYSYMLQIYIDPCRSMFRFAWYAIKVILFKACCCCRMIFRSDSSSNSVDERFGLIEGSDPCGSHRSAIGDWTSSELDTQLIHSNITNSTKIKPYAVFYDETADEVVIAIRGTLSLEDCVTDAMVEPVQFDSNGVIHQNVIGDDMIALGEDDENDSLGIKHADSRWAHEGMLLCALSIRDDIRQKQILGNLSLGRISDSRSPLIKNVSRPFRLVIVGHSLGAGIAAILSFLMRKEYPNLKCYAYGTPGSVVDQKTAVEMSAYVTSTVLADDFISRVSFHSLVRLKTSILDCISRSCANKMKIFQSILKSVNSIQLRDFIGEHGEGQYSNNFKESLLLQIENNQLFLERRKQPRLYIPGRIIHIKSVSSPPLTSLCCFGRSNRTWPCSKSDMDYRLERANIEDFQEISMSSTMAWDHFPDRYLEELKKLAYPEATISSSNSNNNRSNHNGNSNNSNNNNSSNNRQVMRHRGS